MCAGALPGTPEHLSIFVISERAFEEQVSKEKD